MLSQLLAQQYGSMAHTHLVTVWSLQPFWSCGRQQPLAEQAPQSAGQFSQCSPGSHLASPHVAGQAPQSAGQLLQSSPASHFWLPHCTAWQVPHWKEATSSAHRASQRTSQQNGSWSQTQASMVSSSQPGVSSSTQQSPAQLPHWSASAAQMESHCTVQQYASIAQTQSATGMSPHPFSS